MRHPCGDEECVALDLDDHGQYDRGMNWLWTLLVILAIIALVVFILRRVR